MSFENPTPGPIFKSPEGPSVENPSETEEKIIQEKIDKLGSLLHDEWRAPRKKEDGTFEPREKNTKDEEWIKKNETNKVDIANMNYMNLPEDWKGENKKSAEVAVKEVNEAIKNGEQLNDAFIERASDIIHQEWLRRNGSWAPEDQKRPYSELSEEEKEKDRVIIKKAIRIFQEKI